MKSIKFFALMLGLLLYLSGCTGLEHNNVVSTHLSSSELVDKNQMSEKQLQELKPTVKKLFTDYLEGEKKSSVPSERRIKEYKIHDEIKIFQNESKLYFIVTYDTLADSKNYVVAGGGEVDNSGWFVNRSLYIEIQEEDGNYIIKNLSSGP